MEIILTYSQGGVEISNNNALPELSDYYNVSPHQVVEYGRDGHVLLRSVLSTEEVAAYRNVITDVVRNHTQQVRPLEERDTYGKAFLQLCNIRSLSEGVMNFVLAERFAKIAADLMGVNAVRIFADQALYKEPGGGHTPWHQDQTYWPVDTDNTITMWMPLVDIPESVGSMTFVSGSHKLGWIAKEVISDRSQDFFTSYLLDHGISKVSYGAMKAGDATFHSGWTVHSAPGNPTQLMREVMTVVYVADGARVVEPDTPERVSEIKESLGGLLPGSLVSSSANPIVYSRTVE